MKSYIVADINCRAIKTTQEMAGVMTNCHGFIIFVEHLDDSLKRPNIGSSPGRLIRVRYAIDLGL